MPRTELFLGNLGRDISRSDIEKCFDKYGRLMRCDLKNRGFGANFAFLEFEDERDAEDALRGEHGKDLYGSSLVVEWAKSKDRRDRDRSDRDRGGRDGRDRDRGMDRSRGVECFECGERGHFARDCRNRRGSGRNSNRDRSPRERRRTRSRERRSSRSHSRRSSRSHSRRSSRSKSGSKSKHSRHSRRDSRSPIRTSRSPIDTKRSRTKSPSKRLHSRSPKRRATRSPANRDNTSASPEKTNGHAGSEPRSVKVESRSPSYGNDRDAATNGTNGHVNGNGSVKMEDSDHE
jgi:RNA recognition motif-containing protein